MDINDLRSIVTVLGFLLFIVLVAHVWRTRAKPAHEAASRLVLEGELVTEAGATQEHPHG